VYHPRGALAQREEKILLMLAMQTQQLNDRLTRIEERFETSLRDSMARPDQQDLLELRLQAARVSAELSRVTIELRSEINELASARAELIDLTATDADDDSDDELTTAERSGMPLRRLDDHVAVAPAPRPPSRTSGWRPIRNTGTTTEPER
jgi:hypothetical protein